MKLPVPPEQLQFMTSLNRARAHSGDLEIEVAVAVENCPLFVSRVMVNCSGVSVESGAADRLR